MYYAAAAIELRKIRQCLTLANLQARDLTTEEGTERGKNKANNEIWSCDCGLSLLHAGVTLAAWRSYEGKGEGKGEGGDVRTGGGGKRWPVPESCKQEKKG